MIDIDSGNTVETVERYVRRRVVAGIVMIVCLSVFVVAGMLKPDKRGYGTHREFGLPPCQLLYQTGIPCPTCGMTTAVAHIAHGDFLAGIIAQPAGAIFAILIAMTGVISGYVMVTGSAVWVYLRRLYRPGHGWMIIGLIIGAWIYKVVIAVWFG